MSETKEDRPLEERPDEAAGAAGTATDPPPGPVASRESAPSEHLKAIVECLVFVSEHPVTPQQLARTLRTDAASVKSVLAALEEETRERGVQVVEVANGYQMRTSPDHAAWVQRWLQARPVRLSRAALETVSIVAYRQPVTRAEIEVVRGVDCGGVLKLLLDRSLVKILGKKDEPGRPLLYGTTNGFLELFGLRSLRDLPTLREFTELTDEHRALVDSAHGVDASGLAVDGEEPTEEERPEEEELGDGEETP